jgi:hypothetical protein
MVVGAIACFAGAIVITVFLPALHGPSGAASFIQLLGLPIGGDFWMGVSLLVLAAAGIVLLARKRKNAVRLGVAAGFTGCALGLLFLFLTGISAQTLDKDMLRIVMPLFFAWAGTFGVLYLYTQKRAG